MGGNERTREGLENRDFDVSRMKLQAGETLFERGGRVEVC